MIEQTYLLDLRRLRRLVLREQPEGALHEGMLVKVGPLFLQSL